MVASGDPVAYFTLFREGVGVLVKPLDVLLQSMEKRRLQQATSTEMPVILIIGGPRCGTTLLYQTLVQYLPVSYFSNLIAVFPRSPISAGKLFHLFGRRIKQDFRNYYGSVAGFRGPNDGFPIWNRWLGKDRYVVPELISPHILADMRRFFDAWHTAFQKPFMNKNNRNVLCAVQLANALRPAYIIEIRRDPVFVAQSLIQSRLAVQGSKYATWGVGGLKSEMGRNGIGYVDDVCRQVINVDLELDKAKSLICPDYYIQISYERFCDYPSQAVKRVYKQIWGEELPGQLLSNLQPFQNMNRKAISDEEFDRILTCIDALYGE